MLEAVANEKGELDTLKMRDSDVRKWPLIFNEVSSFTDLNGFINIFLENPQSQFADRIQV